MGQLWQEGPYCAFDQPSADGALPQWRCTLFAHHQMSAWDEDDVNFFIHTHLTGTLLLQATQLLLHGEVWKLIKIKNYLYSILEFKLFFVEIAMKSKALYKWKQRRSHSDTGVS